MARRCLVCGREQDHWLHGPPITDEDAWKRAYPQIEQHPFDPGERRSAVRREDDRDGPSRIDGDQRRKLVRRMDDRIALLERALRDH